MNDYYDDPAGEHDAEQWGIAHTKELERRRVQQAVKDPKVNPKHECFNVGSFLKFVIENQTRIHNPDKKWNV